MTHEHVENLTKHLTLQLEVARGMITRSTENNSGRECINLTSEDSCLFDRWIAATVCVIRDNLGITEANKFYNSVEEYDYRNVYRPTGIRCREGIKFIESLIRVCRDFPDQLTYSEPALSRLSASNENTVKKKNATGQSTQVFLIHGHDELNALKLEKHLKTKHGLTATILSDVAGKGRTLIEKFEEEALKASYAFALLTPDDAVQTTDGQYAQARPNVAFELGWFYGRLDRSRVCILLKKGTHLHSDLDGINRVEFQNSVEEVADAIERELRASALIK